MISTLISMPHPLKRSPPVGEYAIATGKGGYAIASGAAIPRVKNQQSSRHYLE
ncbi:hypothetical protein [Nostoc sp. FACHB-888]|uniref:hypothetical protein n=1 Tax=Nostoc sp. FACHB-888 TaxID=2692842 RepID=UPI001F54E20B|nr:hypothetical protein [Nostoc sp. FACHB-888]